MRWTDEEIARQQRISQLLDAIARADANEMRATFDPEAYERLADPAWWEAAAPVLAVVFDPMLDDYGHEIEWWESSGDRRRVTVRAADTWRWDNLLADVVIGLSTRLVAAGDPALELVGLRMRRWLRWWATDARRQRSAARALGLDFPQPPGWPGSLAPKVLVKPTEEWATIPLEGEAIEVMRMVVKGCLGARHVVEHAPPAPRARPWLWCWELERMPPDALQFDERGEPVPLPVVVPVDFDPANEPDRYGFAAEATPGEQLVVDDGERILAAWSGRIIAYRGGRYDTWSSTRGWVSNAAHRWLDQGAEMLVDVEEGEPDDAEVIDLEERRRAPVMPPASQRRQPAATIEVGPDTAPPPGPMRPIDRELQRLGEVIDWGLR